MLVKESILCIEHREKQEMRGWKCRIEHLGNLKLLKKAQRVFLTDQHIMGLRFALH